MTVSLAEAQMRLSNLLSILPEKDELIITDDEQAIARLTLIPKDQPRPQFGNCKGMLTILADDDEHLEDFAEYMP